MNQPAQELFATGLTHHRAGRLDEADRCYVQAIETDPENCDAMLNLAGIRISANRLDEAEALLTAARAIRPSDPNILTALANVHQARGNHDKAEAFYRDAIAQRPDLALAHANLGRLLYQTGGSNLRSKAISPRSRLTRPWQPRMRTWGQHSLPPVDSTMPRGLSNWPCRCRRRTLTSTSIWGMSVSHGRTMPVP